MKIFSMKVSKVFEYVVYAILLIALLPIIIVLLPILLMALTLKWTGEGVANGAAPH